MTRLTREPNQYVVGEWVEKAAWCNELVQVPHACRELAKEFGRLEAKHKVRFGHLSYEVVAGDHPRLSKPQGGKYAAVVFAQVNDIRDTEIMDVSWVHGLRAEDLGRLRAATKAAVKRAKPHLPEIADHEADLIIGLKGPEVARKQLEQKIFEVSGKMLNVANDMVIGD